MVDGGSGVLFQPMTEEYSYVLTARHNLYNDTDQDSYTQPKDREDIKITLHDGSEKNIVKNYEHDSLDIAVLKIDKIEIESPIKQFNEVKNGDAYKFYGYPEIRRQNQKVEDRIQYFDLTVGEVLKTQIVSKNEEYFEKKSIDGCSGGGVFKEDGDNFYLVGIECRMDAQSKLEEDNKRLRFVFIEVFDEIIKKNPSELEPLYPPYMNDFNLLIDNIFLLNNMEEKEKNIIQDRLRHIATNLSKKLKPIDIKNTFSLLESYHDKNNYINRELWSMYLEFIIISVFIDSSSPINTIGLDEINRKRKFLFMKAKDWKYDKQTILTSDFTSLGNNGLVIVCCDGDRTPTSCTLSSETLTNVGNGIMSEKFNIARGIESPHKNFKFKHVHLAQKQMIDDCDANPSIFNGATANNIERIIQDEINKAFS
jgi:hypothetical protein